MELREECKHTLMLEKRSAMSLTGVLAVISFDADSVVADTDCGIIIIKGEDLHIESLNLEKGDLTLKGSVDSLTYEDSVRVGTSFWNKIFR